MFKMNPRLWNTCWWDSGSSHSPWRQGVVLSLCSNQSFCTFASTCRWVYFSCKENSRTRHSAHASSAYCSVLHWKACAWCPWGTDIARGNHQLIVREMKGEVLYFFFFPSSFFFLPSNNCKRISQFLYFNLWRFIRFQSTTTIPFLCSLFGKVVWTNWEHLLNIFGSIFGRTYLSSHVLRMWNVGVFSQS